MQWCASDAPASSVRERRPAVVRLPVMAETWLVLTAGIRSAPLPGSGVRNSNPGSGTPLCLRTGQEGSQRMQIRARMSMSADGYVTTPDGWPALTADPAFVGGRSHGYPEFVESCEAALMGRTTFEPALTTDRWPWPTLNVFVLGSRRPEGTPDHVVSDSDPERLLEKLRAANQGGDVHLVGGARTSETFRALGALGK